MNTPQVIVIALYTLSVGIAIVKHGEPCNDNNAWNTIISVAIMTTLLIWGGFFQ